MPITTAYTAKITHLQILREDGTLDPAMAQPGGGGDPSIMTDEQVLFAYTKMIECRNLDETAF
ncbi:MAG TPA: hypothetical protein VEB22_14895, partial [Phycisphaerales bacterium]|nr:hypothetical protein [Phycisphaerales bacterium]